MKTRFPLPTIILFLAIFVGLTVISARAEKAKSFEPIDSKALIEKCWMLSKEDRKGSTTQMRSGLAKTAQCLQEVIVDQASEMFEPDTLSRQDVQDKLRKISEGYQTLYWAIYNEHKLCGSQCGTDGQLMHLLRYTSLLERIIRDMIEERNDLRF